MVGNGKRSRSPSWLAVLVLGIPMAGCGTSVSTAQTEHATTSDGARKKPASVTATVRSGGLTVTLTATPARSKAGSLVEFDATAYERHAQGAVGYRLIYGDGTATPPSVLPQFCLAAPRPAHNTWRLSHRYRMPGRYSASLNVYVNCTSDHATARITVIVALARTPEARLALAISWNRMAGRMAAAGRTARTHG